MPLPVVPNTTAPPPSDDDAWRAQLRDSVRDEAALARALGLTDDERAGIRALAARGGLPLGITPHYLSLMDPADPDDPLRRQVVPRANELLPTAWDRSDPLGEEELEVVPFLVHRYRDRALLLATDRCAAYCRFCTRKRMVGQGPTPGRDDLDRALAYLAAHPEIREVIVSGGDALVLSDARLAELLDALRDMPHLEVIRLATRVLAFAPMRVTPALLQMLHARRAGPALYVLTHFNHPRELAPRAIAAVSDLVDAGIPVLNQTVLLRGVNDNRATLMELFRAITHARARPYYLHQCDLAPGTDAFRVPLEDARRLYDSLRGHLSGLSIPTFVVDIPGGLGKASLVRDPVVESDTDGLTLEGYAGGRARYPRR